MKALKISLAVIVLAAISIAIFLGMQRITPPPATPSTSTDFIDLIEQEIEQLKTKPDNMFCKGFYNDVADHIDEYYKPSPPKHPFGRFGKTQSENDQWKEILEKNLYSTYTEKFIKQAKTVFSGSEWKPADLKFIQGEKNELKKSIFFVSGDSVDKEFMSIQTTLNKYNEIESFISSCKDFSFLGTSIQNDHFPIADVQNKITRAANLRKNGLENMFVNNCTRLHEGLKEIPQSFFNKHVLYLDHKTDTWKNMHCSLGLNSPKEHSDFLYKPIKDEIDVLENLTIYSGVVVNIQYIRLLKKWREEKEIALKAGTYPCP
jgi:hypothetical protein